MTPNGHETSYKHVIGITSLWLLYPLLTHTHTHTLKTLAWIWILMCSIVSYLMWKDYDKSSVLYTLDIYFARGTFVWLLFINTYAKCMFPASVATMYLVTCTLHSYAWYELAAWSHLMFRFIGLWWTYMAFNNTVTCKQFCGISFVYWVHIAYFMCNSWHSIDYTIATCKLLALIVYCIWLTPRVNFI